MQDFVEDYRIASLITGTLQNISSGKMQELRLRFEQNARFFSGINEVYGIVKAHAFADKEKGSRLSEQPAQARDIYIGLTSNKRFYGTLNRDVARALVTIAGTNKKSDFLMIGLTGSQYVRESMVSKIIECIEFDDDASHAEELQKVFSRASGYARIFVVYPKFINPFRQEVVMTDITQAPTATTEFKTRVDYIFEPEIHGMLQFFEIQVRRTILERVFLEAELARSAARMMRMHSARDHANDLTRVYEQKLRHEFAALADVERMGSYVGFITWKL